MPRFGLAAATAALVLLAAAAAGGVDVVTYLPVAPPGATSPASAGPAPWPGG